jgi:PAS domain S-box-containing protein
LSHRSNRSNNCGHPPLDRQDPGRGRTRYVWVLLAALAAIVLAYPTPAAPTKEVRRILILNEENATYPGISIINQGIQARLNDSPYHLHLYAEYMDTSLFPDPAVQQDLRDSYIRKYRNLKLDLIITVGPSPLKFMQEVHQRAFPGVPIVFCLPTPGVPGPPIVDAEFTGVENDMAPRETVGLALRLLPGTRNVVVVGGVAPIDREVLANVKKQLMSYEGRVEISYLTDLAIPDLLERLRRLPSNTIILLTSIAEDAAGTSFKANESGPLINGAANVPVFSLFDVHLNHGEVGGYLYSLREQGKVAGGLALRLLKGEKAREIPRVRGVNTYMFDWRALKRWGLKESALPPGSIVINRQPTAWESYKWYIIGGVVLILAETLLIFGLVWLRARAKRAETQLRESEERFRLVANTAPVMIWAAGTDRKCSYFNKTWLDFTGRPLEAELGDGWTEGIHPDDSNRCLETYTEAFKRGESFEMECRMRRKDGEYRWVLNNGVPRFNPDGTFVGYIGSCIDITDRKLAESERRRAEALAELDRAKTRFFSNVSHEFRTPLTLMLGPLEDVLSEGREALGPELHKYLVVAHRNALRLLKLVNTILDFSRIEAGRLEAMYEPTDLCRFTQEVSSVFRSAMEKAGLGFSVECEPISEPAYVDRDMWEKMVLNLLSNAFKFTLEGSVVVRLRVVGNDVQLSVTDTGTGIPQEELPRVFERFHRVESSRGRTFEGTGIGLALVRELARLHGGTVGVTTSLGKGSTFTVTIPLGKDHLPADRIQEQPTLRPTALSGETYVEEAQHWLPRGSGAPADEPVVSMLPSLATAAGAQTASQGEIIVVADDNADMREYVTHLLRDKYRVHAVCNGRDAVEATRRLHPDLVLADVMMPVLDGFGVLDAIRNEPSLSSTPVILLSARAGEESRVEGWNAGADDYLVKPFTARELLARIGSHLAMSKIRKKQIMASQHLAAIVESADDAIISKDLNGDVKSWNRAAEKMFGYRAEEMVGRSITAIIPSELLADEPQILETIARGERIDHLETVRVAKNGERIDVSLTISPMKDEKGQIVGAAKIARDITQQKKTERALRISERLASVGRLAATIAHEINNPLEAVTNLVYLAKHTSVSNDTRDFLSGAEEELARISQLTKQTLGYYRETKKAAPMRVGQLVDQLVPVFAARTRNKAVDIRTEIRDDPEIYAVSDDIRRLITNLVNNSIDAVSQGGQIRVRVSPATQWLGNARFGVRITVADTGPGIAPEVRSELFEPFFTTKEEVGTGLGLWLCKGIVERHCGSIRVKSSTAPGKSWTVFSVFLPSSGQRSDAEVLREAV